MCFTVYSTLVATCLNIGNEIFALDAYHDALWLQWDKNSVIEMWELDCGWDIGKIFLVFPTALDKGKP